MKKLFLSLLVVAALFISSGTITTNKAEAYYYGSSYHTYSDTYGGSTTFFSNGGIAHTYSNVYGGSTTFYSNPTNGVYGAAHTYDNGYGGTTTYYSFNY